MNNYYDVLEVPIQASGEAIKTAYRRLAKRYHPDVSPGNEDKFKLVTEAYEVLSNTEKRQRYDSTLNANKSSFSNLTVPTYSLDVSVTVEVSFLSVKELQSKEIIFQRKIICNQCSGVKDDSSVCPKCAGRGKFLNPSIATYVNCEVCAATGRNLKNLCNLCRGDGQVLQEDRVIVSIPAGVTPDYSIRIPGKGNHSNNLLGDLIVQIRIQPDARWERKGPHVWSKIPVTYPQWVLGDIVEVETIWGREQLKIPARHDLMTPLCLSKQGFPNLKRLFVNSNHERGDHFCFLDLMIPNLPDISSEEKHHSLLVDLQKLYLQI